MSTDEDKSARHGERIGRYRALACGVPLSIAAHFWFILWPTGFLLIVALGALAARSGRLRWFGNGMLLGSLLFVLWAWVVSVR